jgi:quinol-cytochrome oxidoreductase complex cytochrome b subunit
MASTEADVFDRLGRGLSALGAWIDDRFPMTKLIKEHATEYYASKNFNFWYGFGVIATVVLVIQLVTGIFLTMNYKPSAADAFASVEYIMRDVEWGWLIRYLHSTGASAFFIVVYLHMFRALLYGSYKKPRELVWIIGMFIYLCLMAEAFFGYLLPWGNMSYWGAQVIVSLFGAVPGIGPDLAEWIRGDFYISDITLNRFFAFHVIAVPLMLVLLVDLKVLREAVVAHVLRRMTPHAVVHEVLRTPLQRCDIADVVVGGLEGGAVLRRGRARQQEPENKGDDSGSHGVTLVGTGLVCSLRV